MRATRRPQATCGCVPIFAAKRSVWAASSLSSFRSEPEVHGLVSLMEIQASRFAARVGPSGEPVLLLDQDRGKWDYLLISRGLKALERAQALGAALGPLLAPGSDRRLSCTGANAEETDWPMIAALYEALAAVAPSPVVELNRAVAVSMASARGGTRDRRRR